MSSKPDAAAGPSPRERSLLAEPGFRTAWAMGAFSGTTRWMETLVIGIYVFDQTASAFLVALFTFLRLAPLSLFSAFMGVFGDRLGRRRLLGIGVVAMVAIYAVQLLLAWSGTIAIWHLGLSAFLTGIYWAADLPLRRTLVGEVAGTSRVGAAMSLDAATNNVTRMVGPVVGGLIYQVAGLEGTFAFAGAMFLGAAACQLYLPNVQGTQGGVGSVLANLREGLQHVRGNRALIGVLVVTVIYNVFGFPFTAMVPVVGKEVLGLGPVEVGLLSGAEGIGAMLTATALAFSARPAWYRRIFFYGTLSYVALVLVLAFSTSIVLSVLLMIGIGLSAACFATMQSTLAFLSAPPEVRGRIMGVVSVCIGTSPIGFAHIGLLANALGAPAAMAVMAVEGLVLFAVLYIWLPDLRR